MRLRRSRRVRVAIPGHVASIPEQLGHGRVWQRVLAELRDDVEFVPNRRADVVLSDAGEGAVETSLPVVTQLHEAPWVVPELRNQVSEELLAWLEPRVAEAVAGADRVLTLSHSAKAIIADGFDVAPERIHVAHPGVDLKTFRPGPGAGLDFPHVLFAATVHPRKNLAALRGAMVELAARGLPHRLVVVAGPASDRPDSKELEAELLAELPDAPGRIVRVEQPSDSELAALMAGCDAFCLPSLWEGFGLTALEAMACGAPVVVSDRGALPEVVGYAGIVCEPAAGPLADALGRVLGDAELAGRMRAAGRARARDFTWRRCANAWLEALHAAVADRAGG